MRILIADGDALSRRKLETFLEKWGYEVAAAADGDEAWAALQGEDAPRLAILDWMMPGKDGVELCRQIRKAKGSPYIYIVILTSRDQTEDMVRGLDAGADDYLTKPYDPPELRARLRAGRRILALQEALLSARYALRFHATLDPLTGVWNRAAILATLQRELARAGREEAALAVFMAGIDGFERITETYGHVTGDSVLREAAQRIRSASRLYDSVARYSEEEFLVIAPGCRAPGTLKQAEKLRASIGGKAFDLAEGMLNLTLSLGVVTVGRGSRLDSSAVLFGLRAALARAKEGGRGRYELARPEDLERGAAAASTGEAA